MKFQYLAIAFELMGVSNNLHHVRVYSTDQESVVVIMNQAKELEKKYWKLRGLSPKREGGSAPRITQGWGILTFSIDIINTSFPQEGYDYEAYRTELIGAACELGWEPFAVEGKVYHFRRSCEE